MKALPMLLYFLRVQVTMANGATATVDRVLKRRQLQRLIDVPTLVGVTHPSYDEPCAPPSSPHCCCLGRL